jgi:hypothetical protein
MSITGDRIRAYTACPTAPPEDPILVAWMTAYDEWENGISCSPSSQDLLDIAHLIDPAICETQRNSEILFDLQCDGWELPDLAAYVRTFVQYV